MEKRIIANEVLFAEVAHLVAAGKPVVITAKGNSMHPFIRGGVDAVELVPAGKLQQFDIVLARIGNACVMHRIIEIRGTELTLMGDGNCVGVERCTLADVVAQVGVILRAGHRIDCLTDRHRHRAKLWFRLKPVRRYLLAFYRRLVLR